VAETKKVTPAMLKVWGEKIRLKIPAQCHYLPECTFESNTILEMANHLPICPIQRKNVSRSFCSQNDFFLFYPKLYRCSYTLANYASSIVIVMLQFFYISNKNIKLRMLNLFLMIQHRRPLKEIRAVKMLLKLILLAAINGKSEY
jgi:hypothetical protein